MHLLTSVMAPNKCCIHLVGSPNRSCTQTVLQVETAAEVSLCNGLQKRMPLLENMHTEN